MISSAALRCSLVRSSCSFLAIGEQHDRQVIGNHEKVDRPTATALTPVANAEPDFADAAKAGDDITNGWVGGNRTFQGLDITNRCADALQVLLIAPCADDLHRR